jgi:hypothetical protein
MYLFYCKIYLKYCPNFMGLDNEEHKKGKKLREEEHNN